MVERTHLIVTGAKGMLGTDLVPMLLEEGFRVTTYDLDTLDITDTQRVLAMPSAAWVINCAAYTAVDRAETDREICRRVNVDGVANLVAYCEQSGAGLVHVSTDYVFNGEKPDGYDEDDPVDPINHYGATKAEGEDLVRKLENHRIARTSWLYGQHGPNFVETVRRICSENGTMRVVNDQRGAPTYTKHLAHALMQLLDEEPGTYHCPGAGSCTWYEFASAINEVYDIGANIVPITSAEFPTPAKRPKFSILNSNKGPKLPSWQKGLQAYYEETR